MRKGLYWKSGRKEVVNLKPQKSKIFGSRKSVSCERVKRVHSHSTDFLGIDDLARLLGKTRMQVEDILKSNNVIELNLSERKQKNKREQDDLRIYE